MQCPKCGYVLGEFETVCLRCKQAGTVTAVAAPTAGEPAARMTLTARPSALAEKECPRCGKATAGDAAVCDKCGYEYQADDSRAERYQALMAEEARTAPPPSALRRTLPPVLSWSIIGASLTAIGVAGWAMFGGIITGQDYSSNTDFSPIVTLHHHKPHKVSIHTVTYKVAGTATQATVIFRSPDGSANPATVALPWMQTFKAKTGTSLWVSAKSADPAAAVTVEIDVDGALLKPSTTLGGDGTVTQRGTL